MPIIRNPFRRGPNDQIHDENGRPVAEPSEAPISPASRPISIRTSSDHHHTPTEYKLSEINDSGVFLPPSPTEKPRMRSTRSQASTNSSSHRSAFTDNEPFNISRESFDSYRRSFDISARSPIPQSDTSPRPRHSFDIRPLPKPALSDKHINLPETQPEDRFEDVGLHDESAKPKKQSFLSRFGHSSENNDANTHKEEGSRPSSSHFGSHFFGRKRGASGQGAELGALPISPSPAIGTTSEGKGER